MDKASKNAFRLALIIPVIGLGWMAFAHLILGSFDSEYSSPSLLHTLIDTSFFILIALVVFFLSREGMRRKFRAEESLDTNLKNYSLLFDNAPLSHMSLDEKGCILSVNDTWCNLTGYAVSEVIGTSFSKLLAQPYRENFDSLFREFLEEGAISGLLVELDTRQSVPLLVEIHGRSFQSSPSDRKRLQCVVRDITEPARARIALLTSASRYKALFDSANDAIFVLEGEQIVDCNAKAEQLFNTSREYLIGLSPADISTETQYDDQPSVLHVELRLEELARERSTFFLWRYKSITGRVFDAEVSLTLLPGVTSSSISIIRDVSERLQAQYALEEAEERFRLAFQTSPDSININRLSDGVYVAINEGFSRMTGFREGEVLGKSSLDLNIWARSEDRDRLIAGLQERGEVQNLEAEFIFKDGTIHTGLMSARIIQLRGEPHVISITRNIDTLKNAEHALRESEEKYRLLVDNSLDGIYMIQDRKISFCNRIQAEMLDYSSPEEVIGVEVKNLISPRSWPMVEANLLKRESGELNVMRYEFFIVKKGGEELEVEVYGSRVLFEGKPAIQGVMRDISERKRMQRQLDQTARLEAVGRLAGGVAHDFNNLLTAIVGHAELGLFQFNESHPFRNDLEEILAISQRGANLTRHLLAFSRDQVHQPKTISLREQILDLDRMLHRVLGEDVQMVLDLAEDDWPVRVDPSQIDQAIINLSINARDAMPNGGMLTLRLENRLVKNESGFFHTEPFSGEYVVLEVSDQGIGIEPGLLHKVFDPFFTTKPVGKGTGLGLSTVYGAVRHADGHMQVESKPGKGTIFRLFFPPSNSSLDLHHKQGKPASLAEGTEQILLVEDDTSVRGTLVKTLKSRGYQVHAVESGNEALEWIDDGKRLPDLVVTDVVMPGIRGTELAEKLRFSFPELPIILISGYREPLEDGKIFELGIPFLQKPFSTTDLLNMIRQQLKTREQA